MLGLPGVPCTFLLALHSLQRCPVERLCGHYRLRMLEFCTRLYRRNRGVVLPTAFFKRECVPEFGGLESKTGFVTTSPTQKY